MELGFVEDGNGWKRESGVHSLHFPHVPKVLIRKGIGPLHIPVFGKPHDPHINQVNVFASVEFQARRNRLLCRRLIS